MIKLDLERIANFIKTKRKKLGLTQEELASKLFVTEKAVSRWETGRGTPDISLLVPLSKVLNVRVSEILAGEDEVEEVIKYNEERKKGNFNISLKLVILFYCLSILLFLIYLRFEYDSRININYFLSLGAIILSSLFIFIGNKIYSDNYVEKIDDKNKMSKLSLVIIFIYYVIFLFNVVIFARYNIIRSYNLIPFYTIYDVISNGSIYSIIINIFGNLFVFMPLEFFIIKLFKIDKFPINFIISLFIIIVIEVLQFIFNVGVFDIDDIIICTLGMMLFHVFYKNLKKLK